MLWCVMLGCMLWRSSAVTRINILVIWKLLCHFKNISVVIYVHILVLLIEWCTLLYHLYVCTCTKRSSKIWDHASRNFLKRHVNMCATFTHVWLTFSKCETIVYFRMGTIESSIAVQCISRHHCWQKSDCISSSLGQAVIHLTYI